MIALISLLLAFGGNQQLKANETTSVERQVRRIEEAHAVRVRHAYDREEFFPARWRRSPISAQGEQIPVEEIRRLLPLVETFLASYPESIIAENLQNIYLLGELSFHGKSYGATNRRDSLYIKSQGRGRGFSDSFLLSRMYSEFSSILLRNYKFPKEAWRSVNPDDFQYVGSGRAVLGRGNLYSQNQRLLSSGFLVKYSQSSLENDFNMISAWLFTQPDRLKRLGKEHAKLGQKVDIAIAFYRSLGIQFD